MEPIVSPWFIYFLSMIDSFGGVIIGMLILSISVAFVCGIVHLIADDDIKEEAHIKLIKWFWRGCVWGCIFIFLSVVIPSRNTIIAMYVADNITSNNVEKALEVGKEFKDEIKKDIFELIETLQKGDSESGD